LYIPKNKLPPFDFIQRNYRAPRADDPIQRWLPHPAVARCICRILSAQGIPKCDIEDALQDVYVKALAAFRKGKPVPVDLRGMKNLCAAIARNYVIDKLREAAQRERDGYAGLCEDADEFTPLEYGAERGDPVDARRQLDVLVQLFREGRMPEHGVDILEGVAAGCSYNEIGMDLGITERAVEGRVGTMRDLFRARMARLGLLPGMQSLFAVVSVPGGIDTLRRAA